MPYVIALWHQKGGVAKTTTALALAACLVEKAHPTLLLDLDPQGNLTTGLGLNPAEARRSPADLLLGNDTVSRVVRATAWPGLDIIPSNPDMVTVSRWLHVREGYEPVLRQALSQPDVAGYDFVFLDCPPMLGPITIAALTAAQLVIVPTQCEYFSVQTLGSSLKLVQLVRGRTNPGLAYRVLVTLFDLRGALHSRVLAQLQQHFAPAMFQTIIGVDSKLRESQLVGTPITLHAPHSRGTQQYRQLAEELCAYVQRPVLQTA